MSDVQRYRSGPVSEVKGFVKAGVLAEVGDLVALNAGLVETFTSLAGSATAFRAKFLGVLVQGATRGTETQNSPCLVYTFCEAEFPLSVSPAVAAVVLGAYVAASADQIVTCGAGGAAVVDAIGRLARAIAVGDTTCLVRIESVIYGGAQTVTVA